MGTIETFDHTADVGLRVTGTGLDDLAARWGRHASFDALVVVGATTSALCWLLIPWIVGSGQPSAISNQ